VNFSHSTSPSRVLPFRTVPCFTMESIIGVATHAMYVR
jgi:hypothetical protein